MSETERVRRVVVTGFEPFGPWSENPTLAVLAALRQTPDPGFELTTLEFPVDSARIGMLAATALDAIRPDIWISLGLAAGLPVVAVERIAANVLDFAIPDNAGVRHDGRSVVDGAPDARFATLPVHATVAALRDAGVPARLSNSASTFLCNQLMFLLLHRIAETGLQTRAGFLHLPAHPALAARHSDTRADLPSMAVELMARGVTIAIRTALEALRAETAQR